MHRKRLTIEYVFNGLSSAPERPGFFETADRSEAGPIPNVSAGGAGKVESASRPSQSGVVRDRGKRTPLSGDQRSEDRSHNPTAP